MLEYNVRFGDPETQTVLPLLSADTDLAEIMLSCATGRLDKVNIRSRGAGTCTYPGGVAHDAIGGPRKASPAGVFRTRYSLP